MVSNLLMLACIYNLQLDTIAKAILQKRVGYLNSQYQYSEAEVKMLISAPKMASPNIFY